MKYIITETQIKKIIKKHLGLDLSDKIEMVTHRLDLPYTFIRYFSSKQLDKLFNNYGPMFVIKTPEWFLAQDRGKAYGGFVIVDSFNERVSEMEILRALGVSGLGISLNDIINAYVEE